MLQLASTRLPFHPLLYGEPWKIISRELNGDTVSVWLPVIVLLGLNADQMYLTAIQNMTKGHVKVRYTFKKI